LRSGGSLGKISETYLKKPRMLLLKEKLPLISGKKKSGGFNKPQKGGVET
jgi:hypothetical protein